MPKFDYTNMPYEPKMNIREAIVILNDYRSVITNSDFKKACEIAISELEKQEDIIIRNIELTELCSKLTNILSENKDTKES